MGGKMENRERYKRIIMFLASALIVAIQTLLFAYIWYKFYAHKDVIGRRFDRGNQVVIGLYVLMLYFFYKIYGGFKVGYLRVFEVLYSQVLSVVCVNFITYLQLCLIGRWRFGEHLMPMVEMTGIDLVVVLLWVVGMRWIYTRLYPPRQMLMIYGNRNPGDLRDKLETREDKYAIQEMVPISLGLDAIKQKIDGYSAVVIGDLPSHERNVLLKYCFEKDIRCYSIPKLSDILLRNADDIHLFDTTLLLSRNLRLTAEQLFFKRVVDIVFSLVGLVIASPFMLVIALAIKLYDGGPVFYKQPRLTRDKKVFMILKFRSMKMDSEEKGAQLAKKEDDRITPVGKIIRRIHFDELPQIINILKGEMSLVGPRPERPEIAELYREWIPEFDYRLKVKAGLTGYAQVYGKYNTTPYDKLKLDLTYIETYSLRLDLKLLMLTFKILFQKENTEGVEAWQKTAGQEKEPAGAAQQEEKEMQPIDTNGNTNEEKK